MYIGSQTEFVEILALEKAPEGAPNAGDVRIAVQVTLGEFNGRYESVWLEEPVLRDFVHQLSTLEKERTGSARLTSCSPDEFVLSIRSQDKLGHIVAEVSLSRYRYGAGEAWATTISGCFGIDAGSLLSLLDDFRSLHGSSD
jgi:hypothetical protein